MPDVSPWTTVRLGDLAAKIQDGTHFSPKSQSGPFRYLTSRNIRMGFLDLSSVEWISEAEHRAIYARCDPQPGDVLLTKDGANTGNVTVNDLNDEFSLLSSVAMIRGRDRDSSRFIYHFLASPQGRRQIEAAMAGNAITRLTLRKIKNLEIPVPPPRVQRRIVEILDTIDDNIRATERIIAKLEVTRIELMHHVLGPGIGASPPPGWRVCCVEELLGSHTPAMRSGPFGSALLASELVEAGVPLLGIDNINREEFVPTYRRFVSEQKARELDRYRVLPGDLMITIMGTVGRCCVVPQTVGHALSSKHVWTVTLDREKYLPELACLQVNYSRWALAHLRRHAQGGIMSAISSETLRSLPLPAPPRSEQQRIWNVLRDATTRLKNERSMVVKLRLSRQGAAAELLSGRVRTVAV